MVPRYLLLGQTHRCSLSHVSLSREFHRYFSSMPSENENNKTAELGLLGLLPLKKILRPVTAGYEYTLKNLSR